MRLINTRKVNIYLQCIICSGVVFLAAILGYLSSSLIGYYAVALILLMALSVNAMLFDIIPVLLSALFSALIWDYFFIPPINTFHVEKAEDLLMLLSYFIVASVNAVLNFKIRKAESKAREKIDKQRAINFYNTLLNSLSHELRTPVAAILGAIDTLKDNGTMLKKDQYHDLLSTIDTASVRLNRQVENLLNMSRLQSGMLQPKMDWCDVNDLVISSIQKVLNPKNRPIHFETNVSMPLCWLDGGLIEQVIQNLLHNSLTYTPVEASICVTVDYIDDCCTIIVSDNGPGIPADSRYSIFDKFYRLPNSQPGGSGLGLSIVQGFLEVHTGKISVNNAPTGGAVFTVVIPAKSSYINILNHE